MGFENLKEMLPKFKKEEPQQKEPPQEDDDERNDVTHMRAKEKICLLRSRSFYCNNPYCHHVGLTGR